MAEHWLQYLSWALTTSMHTLQFTLNIAMYLSNASFPRGNSGLSSIKAMFRYLIWSLMATCYLCSSTKSSANTIISCLICSGMFLVWNLAKSRKS